MPRRGITKLPKPLEGFRVTRGKWRIETPLEARAETLIRINRLLSTSKMAPDRKLAKACRLLAEKLLRCLHRGRRCKSPACPLCMRKHRKRIASALWRLVVEDDAGKPVTATLVPRGMDFPAGQLGGVCAAKLKAALLADLNRCGAKEADGYLFAALHGEFEPNKKRWIVHWHLLLDDEMIEVLDRLRERPKFRSQEGDVVRHRVRIGRKRLNQLPKPLTYLTQSWWPSRWIGDVGGGEIKRQRQRSRVPEPYHSEYLLWLDQQEFEDLILLRKLSVTPTGLRTAK